MADRLSDPALAVFAFAAYHQLSSGETVREVVLQDGAGHAADPKAVRELSTLGLLEPDGDRGAFTEEGLALFDRVLEGLRSAGLQSA